ncbi:unnamed protein product [Paramecium octaurelia]|uniref:Uncharacterized protein n=1 Tax=Paramecium octaurelia TaxID=43137 RepID=A0A8S1X727_PAROT|nr:unnamed protein product [Paramecium octaurelia]
MSKNYYCSGKELFSYACSLTSNQYHIPTNCGPFSQCKQLYQSGALTAEYGCCRYGYLSVNAVQIIVYIIILPIIGVGILGALGGGVVKRPFLEATLNFDSESAGNMTMCLQFGSQLANIIIIFFQRHPEDPERPIINFEIALIYCLAIPLSQSLGTEFANYLPLGSLLWIQNIFFVAICPILFLFATKELTLQTQKEQDNDILLKSALVPLEGLKDQQQLQQQEAVLYKQFYNDQCNKFPLFPIVITVGNFAINEAIILSRTTPGLTSPYYTNETTKERTICSAWNFYMLLLLFAVNTIITLVVYYIKRKEEYTKDAVKFFNCERFYTPGTRFWKIYAAGWVTGIVAGFFGMAAGLIMVTTMSEFGLISAVAGGTANYCYFIICCQLFATVLSNQIEENNFGVGDQFFFYGLGIISVLIFTNIGYYYLKKYNIGHALFYIDFALVLLNIAGNLAWGIETSDRHGYKYLMNPPPSCNNTKTDF